MKKRMISLILALCIVFSFGCPALADGPVTLDTIASGEISVEIITAEDGTVSTKYGNIHAFVEAAKEEFPELTDYELGCFIMEYTGHNSDALPVEEAEAAARYLEIVTTVTHIEMPNPDGVSTNVHVSIAPCTIVASASYGSMDITLTQALTQTVNGKNYVTISVDQEWVGLPGGASNILSRRLLDSLVLYYSSPANYDDTVTESGYIRSCFNCASCGQYNNNIRYVSGNSTVGNDVYLKYTEGTGFPYIQFVAPWRTCSNCAVKAENEVISSHLAYGIKLDIGKTANAYATYYYTYQGNGTYSLSLSLLDLTPSIVITSGSVQTESFTGRPITIN